MMLVLVSARSPRALAQHPLCWFAELRKSRGEGKNVLLKRMMLLAAAV